MHGLQVQVSHVPHMTDAELRRYERAAIKYAKHEVGDARRGAELARAIRAEMSERGLVKPKAKKAKRKKPKAHVESAKRKKRDPKGKKGGFAKLEHELERRRGVRNPRALAAYIERKAGLIR